MRSREVEAVSLVVMLVYNCDLQAHVCLDVLLGLAVQQDRWDLENILLDDRKIFAVNRKNI